MMKLVATIAIALASSLCGCASHPSKMGPPDACALLPKKVAEEVLDVKLSEPKSQPFGANPWQTVISNCRFLAQSPQPVGSLNLTIRLGSVTQSLPGPAETFVATMKQDFGQRYQLQKIKGVGDGAVWDSSLRQLTVFSGTTTYVLTSPGATLPDLEDRLVTLAKKTIVAGS